MNKRVPTMPLVATGAAQGAAQGVGQGAAQAIARAASRAQVPLPGWPVFRPGFRPFYLGATAFALFAVPYWMAGLLGWAALPSNMPPMLWHAHEMLFGFAVAVIVGFLLTAGKAWTGLATPRGATLAAAAWATAFALYLWVFTPWLLGSRLDGKDG